MNSLSHVGHPLTMTVVSSCQHACIQEVRNSYTMDAKATTQLQTLVVRSLEEEGYKLGRIKFHSGLWIGDNVVLKTMRIDELHASTVGIRATYIPLKKMFLSGKEIHVEEFVKQCVVSMGSARCVDGPSTSMHTQPILRSHCQCLRASGARSPWTSSRGSHAQMVLTSSSWSSATCQSTRTSFPCITLLLLHRYRTFLDTGIKLPGVSDSIISDRDKIFICSFWRELFALMGTKLLYTMATTIQSDGRCSRCAMKSNQIMACNLISSMPRHRSSCKSTPRSTNSSQTCSSPIFYAPNNA